MLQREHSAILSTFIKLSFIIKIFVLSIFEWSLYTGFTVLPFLVFLFFGGIKINKADSGILGDAFQQDFHCLQMMCLNLPGVLTLKAQRKNASENVIC